MLEKLRCPNCDAENYDSYKSYETRNNGSRILYRCASCKQIFSETKGTFLEGLRKPIDLIIKVLKARSEGT